MTSEELNSPPVGPDDVQRSDLVLRVQFRNRVLLWTGFTCGLMWILRLLRPVSANTVEHETPCPHMFKSSCVKQSVSDDSDRCAHLEGRSCCWRTSLCLGSSLKKENNHELRVPERLVSSMRQRHSWTSMSPRGSRGDVAAFEASGKLDSIIHFRN